MRLVRRFATGQAMGMPGDGPMGIQQMSPPVSVAQAPPNGLIPGPNGSQCIQKVFAQQLDLGSGVDPEPPATGTWTVTSPGSFCPSSMTIVAFAIATGVELTEEEMEDIRITGISSGLRRQIISGSISAMMFSRFLDCCPITCFDCLCVPGMGLVVTAEYTGDIEGGVRAYLVVRGNYADICPPDGVAPSWMRPPLAPGCVGNEKLLGFEAEIPANSTVEVEVDSPGSMCIKDLFFTSSASGVQLADVSPNLSRLMIGGPVPLEVWGYDNECCPFDCFGCTCAPSQPFVFTFTNTTGAPITVNGDMVVAYQDAC